MPSMWQRLLSWSDWPPWLVVLWIAACLVLGLAIASTLELVRSRKKKG